MTRRSLADLHDAFNISFGWFEAYLGLELPAELQGVDHETLLVACGLQARANVGELADSAQRHGLALDRAMEAALHAGLLSGFLWGMQYRPHPRTRSLNGDPQAQGPDGPAPP